MKNLLKGYQRFRNEVFPQMKDHFRQLAEVQSPEVLFITCADSRIVPSLILQAEPGDLFVSRSVGNIVPPFGETPGGVTSTLEYAVKVLKVRHVIICGHSDCGAIKAVVGKKDLSGLPNTGAWLKYVDAAWQYCDPGSTPKDPKELHTTLIYANVIAQLHHLKTHPEVADGLANGTLQIHGWYYDIPTGSIETYNEQTKRFHPLEDLIS
ncbi:carbonic anhydrase [Acidobacterium sp. S8]|uniref:carbonic anhydrase n=1 Tax=Acidobacterium sp. S8 TaxID=1641854 RepID=UPI00131E8504|nr:carbonic anhydrase [Acidobacterium sp. S8]